MLRTEEAQLAINTHIARPLRVSRSQQHVLRHVTNQILALDGGELFIPRVKLGVTLFNFSHFELLNHEKDTLDMHLALAEKPFHSAHTALTAEFGKARIYSNARKSHVAYEVLSDGLAEEHTAITELARGLGYNVADDAPSLHVSLGSFLRDELEEYQSSHDGTLGLPQRAAEAAKSSQGLLRRSIKLGRWTVHQSGLSELPDGHNGSHHDEYWD